MDLKSFAGKKPEEVDSDSRKAKKFVCDGCSKEKIEGLGFIGTSCPECGGKMILKGTAETPVSEVEKDSGPSLEEPQEENKESRPPRKLEGEWQEVKPDPSEEPRKEREEVAPDSWWGKKFVCKGCSVEKVTRTDVIDTSCPECGEEMTFWRAVKGKKDSDRDIHSKYQSTEDQSDGKEWWGEGRWWSTFWIVPFVPFMSWSLIFMVGMTPLGSNSSDRIFRAEITLEGLLLFVCLSALILAVNAWILLKEQDWERNGPWIVTALIVAMGVFMVTRVQGPVVKEPLDIGRYALRAVSAFEYATILFSFLWIAVIRLAGAVKIGSPQKSGTDGTNTSSHKRRINGYIYVAENPEIPGKVKIGYTTRSVNKRMKELSSSTGVPGKYKAIYKVGVARPKHVEKKVHRKLSHRRIQDGGEFFKVDPEEAARVIKKVRG